MNTQSYAVLCLNDGDPVGWLVADESLDEVTEAARAYEADHQGEVIVIVVPVLATFGKIA